MQKITFFKHFFLSFILYTGIVQAQSASDKIVKKAEFGKKYQAELIKSNGIDRCSTVEYENYLKERYPRRMSNEQFEKWLAPLVQKAKANKSESGGIITIPVVVHVIHSGQNVGVAPNIVDAQVESQITVMNNDFRRIAGTTGFNSNAVGSDTQIQFVLAKVDPNGNPTNGIDRINLCKASWGEGEIENLVKPQTIWDPTQYMNMWSLKFSNNTLLGYAQFPSNSGLGGLEVDGGLASTDGVVAKYSTFGSSDYNDGTFLLNAPYDKGRTMTHEVGHFLGLRHIWGDSACGNDYCADTPTAHGANYICNTTIASCDDPSIYEMVQNYMDYTNDTCMNIFTVNQKERITAVMNNSPRRMELKASTKDAAIPLFPNDAEIKLEGDCSSQSCISIDKNVVLLLTNRGTNTMTNAVITYTINGNSQTYNWSGSLTLNKSQTVSITIPSSVPSGPMNIKITSVNGVADQRDGNSNIDTQFVSSSPTSIGSPDLVFRLQLDYWGSETTWTLKNSAGAIVYSGGPYNDVVNPTPSTPLPALITQNWALVPDCYTFTINDSFGDGIYTDGGYYDIKTQAGADVIIGSPFGSSQSSLFKYQVLSTNEVVKNTLGIYPNPTTDILNITNLKGKATYIIHNAVGQLVLQGEVKDQKINVSDLTKGVYVLSLENNGNTINLKFVKK